MCRGQYDGDRKGNERWQKQTKTASVRKTVGQSRRGSRRNELKTDMRPAAAPACPLSPTPTQILIKGAEIC